MNTKKIAAHVASLSISTRTAIAASEWDEVMTDALYAACGAETAEQMAEARAAAGEAARAGKKYKLEITGMTINGASIADPNVGYNVADYFGSSLGEDAFSLRFDDPRAAKISLENLYKGDDADGVGFAWHVIEEQDAQ